MTSPVEIVLFTEESDGECLVCRDVFEIVSFAAYDSEFICPACAERCFPGIEQILKGLSMIHEAVCLDMLTRDAAVVTGALRMLADMTEKIGTGQAVVQVRVGLEAAFCPDLPPLGITVERRVVTAKEPA